MKYAKLIFKNILRNPIRTLLTISSLVVSLFLIVTLATILTEFDRGTEETSPLRLVSRHAVSLGFVIPVAHLQKMKTVPGVKEAMPFSWFGGIYKDERNFFANFAVDARKMRDVIPEIKMSDADWQAFINDRQGAIVGAKLVKLHGFTPGQRITLKSPIYNQEVEFIIRGVYTGSDEKTLYFQYDYLNELLPAWAKDQVSTFSIVVYDTHKKDNEKQSAEWARESALDAGVKSDQSSRIYDLIMATMHNAVPAGKDAQVLVDIDLGILSAEPARFDEYELQVREEYSWVPEFMYRRARRKVLEEFVGRHWIYSTEIFRSEHEARARENLTRSLARL